MEDKQDPVPRGHKKVKAGHEKIKAGHDSKRKPYKTSNKEYNDIQEMFGDNNVINIDTYKKLADIEEGMNIVEEVFV